MNLEALQTLGQLITRLHDAASRYEHASGLVESPGAKAEFSAAAERRRRLARGLEEEMRREGMLPKAPDPDKEDLERLATKAKVIFTDKRKTLLKECVAQEYDLAASARQALKLETPPGIRTMLEGVLQSVQAACSFLNSQEGTQ